MDKDNTLNLSIEQLREMLKEHPDTVFVVMLKEEEDEGSKDQACNKDAARGI